MSVKLFIPAVGAVGTIASVAGVSSSSQRSNSYADTTPTHKWKIEVEEISVGLDCKGGDVTGDGDRTLESKEVRLTWVLAFEKEKEVEPLLRDETITKNAYVELKKEEDVKLWPILLGKKNEYIRIEKDQNNNQLKITLGNLEAGTTDGRGWIMMAQKTKRVFTCDVKELLIGKKSGHMIYQGMMEQVMLGQWTSTDSMPLKVSISLSKCESSDDGKQAECSLKVVTGSDLDWSTKVSAKAKISILE